MVSVLPSRYLPRQAPVCVCIVVLLSFNATFNGNQYSIRRIIPCIFMGSASISEHLPCSGCDTKSCRFSSEPSHSSQAVDMCWGLVSPPFKRISRHSLHGHSYMSALYSSVVRDNTEFWWTENEFQLIFHCKNKAMKVFWSTCMFYKIKRFFWQQVISHWASPRGNSRLSTLL